MTNVPEPAGCVGSPTDPLPTRRAQLHIAAFEEELVILVPDDRRVHLLDPLCAAVFELCDGRAIRADALRALDGVFASDEHAWAAIDQAITALAERGIVSSSRC